MKKITINIVSKLSISLKERKQVSTMNHKVNYNKSNTNSKFLTNTN